MKRQMHKFKSYAIQLNTNALSEKLAIQTWLNEHTKAHILNSQMITVLFFSESEAFHFHLTFFDCMQTFHLRYVEYPPQDEGILAKLLQYYDYNLIK